MVPRWFLFALPGVVAVGVRMLAAAGAGLSDDESLAFRALAWREIGPFRAGRSVAAAGSAARPLEYYQGTTGGGVLKTVDGGHTWFPVTDRFFGGSIGAIAIAESNPDTVYVGTGEYDIRGNVSHGDGMFRSTDAGKTWSHIGLDDSRQISRVRIDPRNPDVVYVGVQGHVWKPNGERGVYKTTDGGKSWRRVLFRDESTGATDLILDPSSSDIIYAAFWESGRTPWTLVSGGPGSGLFKSIDAGGHWTELSRNPGFPAAPLGHIGVTVSPANPNRVWAIVEAHEGGVYRSDDAGQTWTRTSTERELRRRPWYFSRIFADPKDANTVWGLGILAMRSRDGGKSFSVVRNAPHGDFHELWIAPDDSRRMILADDGGAQISADDGASWSSMAQPTGQFYHVTTTTDFPYRVCGAQQDNTTLCGPSRADGGIDIGAWYQVGGGESGYIAVRPDKPNVVFAGSYGGLVDRFDVTTHLVRRVSPWPDWLMEHPAADDKYRFQYTSPLVISPNDSNILYSGANVLFRSTNDGQHWDVISPDLTRNDPGTQQRAGGPITPDNTGPEIFGTIFTVAESPISKGVIWAGSDDGLVHVTRDEGKSWKNVTPPGIPKWLRMSMIEPSHFDDATAFLAANNYQMDDLRPYVFKTHDYGATWTAITSGIPAAEFARVVREDPMRRGLLYAGTERGVWVSLDEGGHWRSLKQNLPPVPVHDLALKDGDLIACTHGRGFWILDDISPLWEFPPAPPAPLSLFTPRQASLARFSTQDSRKGLIAAPNPPDGLGVYYWLDAPRRDLAIDILDPAGGVIRSFVAARSSAAGVGSAQREGPSNDSGLNVFHWNLRLPDPVIFRGMQVWSRPQGPFVLPGRYSVRLTVEGQAIDRPFIVAKDPRSTATGADLEEQLALARKILESLDAVNNGVRVIRNIKSQIARTADRLAQQQRAALTERAAPVLEALDRVEGALYQGRGMSDPIMLNDRLGALAIAVIENDGRPTDQSYAAFREETPRIEAELGALKTALERLTGVNQYLSTIGRPPIVPTTAELPASDEPVRELR
jgi:photosystem II stability/assembly factor-like uncharacterized protein